MPICFKFENSSTTEDPETCMGLCVCSGAVATCSVVTVPTTRCLYRSSILTSQSASVSTAIANHPCPLIPPLLQQPSRQTPLTVARRPLLALDLRYNSDSVSIVLRTVLVSVPSTSVVCWSCSCRMWCHFVRRRPIDVMSPCPANYWKHLWCGWWWCHPLAAVDGCQTKHTSFTFCWCCHSCVMYIGHSSVSPAELQPAIELLNSMNYIYVNIYILELWPVSQLIDWFSCEG